MANWSDLKEAIASIVKTNGNKEITGQLLQNVLNNIISNVGLNSSFAGIATPETNPGTPDGNVFYLATTAGTYSNFNGIIIEAGESVILEWKGSWTKKTSGFATQEKLSELGSQLFSYITTEPKIDFINNQINIYKGYAVIGEKAFMYNGQVLLFNETPDDEYLVFNSNSKTFEVYSSVGYKGKKGYFVIATIIKGDFNIMVGNFPQKNYETGYIFGKVSFAFDKDKWTVDVDDSVYYEVLKNSDLYKITEKQILISNMNYAFLFVNSITKELEVIPYHKVKDIPIENYVFIGFVDPNNKKVFAQISSIMIDGNEIVYFTQKEKDTFGKVVEDEYPAKDWMSKSFPAQATAGEIFLDKRCKIDYYHRLKKIRINCHTSGELQIIYLDANFNHVYTQKVTAESYGVQEFNEPGISYDQPYFYVAIKSTKEGGSMSVSSGVTGNEYGCVVETYGSVKPLAYDYGYSLVIEDTYDTLDSRLERLENSFNISEQSDINKMLALSDVVTLEPKDYYISVPIILTSGKVLQGSFGKTRLILTNGCKTAISASNANDIKVSDIEIVGTCPNYSYDMNGIVAGDGYEIIDSLDDVYVTYPGENKGGTIRSTPNISVLGEEKGIYLYYCENVVLSNLKINHIDGSAIRVNHVGMSYIKGLNAVNIFISNCCNGIWTENEHEFSQYTNFTITLCQVGILISSGNLIFSNGHITRGIIGVALLDGYNHGHGVIDSIEVKHNKIAGIYAKDCTYGEQIGTISMQYSDLILDNCKGIIISTMFFSASSITCNNSAAYSSKNYIGTIMYQNGDSLPESIGNLYIGKTITATRN